MAKKVYLKKGNLNYKERKYITAIEKGIQEKGLTDADYESATNFGELEEIYNKIAVQDVEYTEVNEAKGTTSVEDQHKDFRDGIKENVVPNDKVSDNSSAADDYTDPFNQGEVVVRDYVGQETMRDTSEVQQETKTTFEEPTTFSQSFEMPKNDDDGGGKQGGSSNSGGLIQRKDGNKKETKPEPINPEFDSMSSAKKKKSTKKMAKAIVEGVCKLAEFGSIWWVTKDITEDKVIQYEINDTIDVQILLSLDENQQITVKNWFARQVKDANEILRISDDDKSDLVDSLYEVMLEKGVAPTPMQELIINAVSTIVFGLGVKAYAMGQQINSVLNQLILMRAEQKEAESQQQARQNTTDMDDIYEHDTHRNDNSSYQQQQSTNTDAETNNQQESEVEFVETEEAFDKNGDNPSTDLTIVE